MYAPVMKTSAWAAIICGLHIAAEEVNATSEQCFRTHVDETPPYETTSSSTTSVAMHARALPGTSMRHRRTHKSQPSWFAKAAILDR